jgi:hypothetical protein
MLTKLLERVGRGGIHITAALAHELGVSEGLLAQMTEDLARMGYLEPVSGDCGARCGACPLASGCSIGGLGGVWALTEKGMRVTAEE